MTTATVYCDECRHEFAPQPTETPVAGGGIVIGFTCPECDHEYGVATITARGVKLRARLAEAVKGGDRRMATRLRKRYQQEVTLASEGRGVGD